jgi:hypothetical protein
MSSSPKLHRANHCPSVGKGKSLGKWPPQKDDVTFVVMKTQ